TGRVLRHAWLCVVGSSAILGYAGHPGHEALPPAQPAIALTPDPEPDARRSVAWAAALPALRFVNTRTGADVWARLYAADGTIDEHAAAMIDVALADRDAAP